MLIVMMTRKPLPYEESYIVLKMHKDTCYADIPIDHRLMTGESAQVLLVTSTGCIIDGRKQ